MFFSFRTVSSRQFSSFHQHLAYSFVLILTSGERLTTIYGSGISTPTVDRKWLISRTSFAWPDVLPAFPRIDTAEHDLGFKQFFCCFLQLKGILTTVEPLYITRPFIKILKLLSAKYKRGWGLVWLFRWGCPPAHSLEFGFLLERTMADKSPTDDKTAQSLVNTLLSFS